MESRTGLRESQPEWHGADAEYPVPPAVMRGRTPVLPACRSLDLAAPTRAVSGAGTDSEAEDHGPDGERGHGCFWRAHDAGEPGPGLFPGCGGPGCGGPGCGAGAGGQIG